MHSPGPVLPHPGGRFLAAGQYAFGNDALERVVLRVPEIRIRRGRRAHVTLGNGGKITLVVIGTEADDRGCVHEFGHCLHAVLDPKATDKAPTYRCEMAAIWAEARFYTLFDEHSPGALEWWMKEIFEPYYLLGAGPYRAAAARLAAAWDADDWSPSYYNPVAIFRRVFHEQRAKAASASFPAHPILRGRADDARAASGRLV